MALGMPWEKGLDLQNLNLHSPQSPQSPQSTVAFIHHLSTSLRRCFFSLLLYSATRFREYIPCCMRRTDILKNNSTAEKRREEEAFALKSIAYYYFVEIKRNCEPGAKQELENMGG